MTEYEGMAYQSREISLMTSTNGVAEVIVTDRIPRMIYMEIVTEALYSYI